MHIVGGGPYRDRERGGVRGAHRPVAEAVVAEAVDENGAGVVLVNDARHRQERREYRQDVIARPVLEEWERRQPPAVAHNACLVVSAVDPRAVDEVKAGHIEPAVERVARPERLDRDYLCPRGYACKRMHRAVVVNVVLLIAL